MKIFSTLLVFLSVFTCGSLQSQITRRCGTDEQGAAINKRFPATVAQRQQSEELYQLTMDGTVKNKTSNGTRYIIPVVVHVIHRVQDVNIGDTSNIWETEIIEQIEILNRAYRGQTSVHASETDGQIEFRLASKDPNGNCHSGIIRMANNESIAVDATITDPSLSFKRLSHWPSSKYLNLYIVHSISGGTLGFATFPWNTGTPALDSLDGIVISYKYIGYNQHPNYGNGNTTVHEVGHWLGLYHTFQPDCYNPPVCDTIITCRNDTCTANGDKVCDTPPVGTPNYTSSPCGSSNSCNTDHDDTTYLNPFRDTAFGGIGNQPDQIQNYMDYSDDVCMERFTIGQQNRMNFHLVNYRPTLWSDANLVATGSKGLLHDFDSVRTGFALNGKVKAMVEWPAKHRLIVAGDFTVADGIPVNGIAQWDGTKWDSLLNVPAGMTGQIYAMEVYENALFVGGTFNITGQCKYLARHGGSLWLAVTDTITTFDATSGPVNALKTYKGKLYVGGDFGQVNGNKLNANRIASWNGMKWDTLRSGLFGNSSACYALTSWNNYLVVGGRFVKAGGYDADKIALWNGDSWASINTGSNVVSSGRLNCLGSFGSKLYAGGDYSSLGGSLIAGLSVYDGQFWGINSSSPFGINRFAIEPYNGYLWVGGDINSLGTYVSNVYTFDDVNDTMLAVNKSYDGFDNRVLCMTQYKDELYIGGEFTKLRGVNGFSDKTVNYICKVKTYCENGPSFIKPEPKFTSSAFSIFPNPADDVLHVMTNEKLLGTEISVFDLTGKKIKSIPVLTTKLSIQTSGMASGLYFVRIGTITKKFVRR